MPRYDEQTGRTKRVVLEPQVTRAYWSKRRAWQGEQLKLFVETRYVADGTVFKVEVWEDQADTLVAQLPGEHKIENNRCEIAYEIKWDQESLGKELTLKGKGYEFFFVVAIDKPELQGKSNLLYVDLHPLLISA